MPFCRLVKLPQHSLLCLSRNRRPNEPIFYSHALHSFHRHVGPSNGATCRLTVKELEQVATNEAQQRDESAKRAFANTQIKTADGKCLFVVKLSGDFKANLTPVQIAAPA
ncbi:hypothetical protein E4U32_005099 [Claviceps aff. humidiphila group G2b]|nr:hypothetical protein E4U32_005099 [Claviceps aff. humidiphila group G2b]